MPLLIIGAVIVAIYFVWFAEDDVWSAYVYPNANDLMVDHFAGEFSTLENCRDAAKTMIEINGWTNADYECGLNCEPWEGTSINVCEETLR